MVTYIQKCVQSDLMHIKRIKLTKSNAESFNVFTKFKIDLVAWPCRHDLIAWRAAFLTLLSQLLACVLFLLCSSCSARWCFNVANNSVINTFWWAKLIAHFCVGSTLLSNRFSTIWYILSDPATLSLRCTYYVAVIIIAHTILS